MSENYMAKKLFDEGAAAYLKEDYKTSIRLFTQALQTRSQICTGLFQSRYGVSEIK